MIKKISNRPHHRQPIGVVDNGAVIPNREYAVFFDWLPLVINNLVGEALNLSGFSYTVATVPNASDNPNSVIFVTDEAGGAVPAFSRGSDWRRVTDGAVIS